MQNDMHTAPITITDFLWRRGEGGWKGSIIKVFQLEPLQLLTGFANNSKLTALKTPVVLAPLRPSPGSAGLGSPLLLGSDIEDWVKGREYDNLNQQSAPAAITAM